MSLRSTRPTVVDLDPSDLTQQTHAVALYFNMLKTYEANRVHAGGIVKVATTPSAQLTGVGNTTWSVDVEAIIAACGGVLKEIALAADFSIHAGSFLTGLASLSSAIAAIVLKNVSGTVTMVAVIGTPFVTASGGVGPSDAVIQAAVGAGNAWVQVSEATLNRTADTTVTESWDSTQRPALGINVDEVFATFVG